MALMRKKSVQVVLTLVLSAGIILAGAFAWFSFTQSALNAFDGISNPGGNLHDDYEQGETNKDVYVENNGNRPIYVRVKLDEYMDINGLSLISGGVKDKMDTWNPHSYLGTTVNNCGEEPHDYYEWIMGNATTTDKGGNTTVLDPDAGLKYYLPAPFANQARFDEKGNQTKEPIAVTYADNNETMGTTKFITKYGTDVTYGTLETGYEAYERVNKILYTTDAAGVKTDTQVATDLKALYAELDAATSATARKTIQVKIDTFLKDNNLGYWDKVYKVDAKGAINEPGVLGTDFTINFVPMRRTLTTVKLYTMADWIAAGTPTGDFWILDTDGWAYWGDVLQPNASTGLLLSEVVLDEDNKPAGNWYYGINVKMQAVTYDDINRFGLTAETVTDGKGYGGGITDQGMMILQAASGNYAFDMKAGAVGANDPVYTFVNNKDNTYRLMTSDGTNTITYSPLFVYTGTVPPAAKGDIYNDGIKMGDASYQIGQTFMKDIPFGLSNVKFTVTDLDKTANSNKGTGTAVVEGKDGKHYIKLTYQVDDGTGTNTKKDATAWLAVGADKKFDALTKGTAPDTNMYSKGDDVLVWTADKEPGGGNDRQVEDASASYKIGDTFKADGKDWVIIGMDTKEGSTTKGQTLVISKDVLATKIESANIVAELAKYSASGTGTEKLNDMVELGSGTNKATPQLLTIQDAMDYFADNAARIATDGTASTKWWLDGSAVDVNGALGAKEGMESDGTTPKHDIGIRVALWVDSTKLQEMLHPTTTP